MNQQQVTSESTTRELFEQRVRVARRKLDARRAETPPDPSAVSSAEHALAAAELARDSLITAAELVPAAAEPINWAQPITVDTSPTAPPPAPRYLASTAAAAALSAQERRTQAARDAVIGAERELDEAVAERRKYPDAEETKARRIAARASLTELEIELGEREGDLDALRQTLATSEIVEADRLFLEGSADATERALGPFVEEAERIGKDVGALLLRAYGVVDAATAKRERAYAIVRKLGLATPRNPEEFERSSARYRVVRGLRSGLQASLGSHLFDVLDALARWVR